MGTATQIRKRWPKGTWMRLESADMLKALMARPGREFSLGRLARYAGCDKSFISHLTSGRRRSCTPELAQRIAEALDVPIQVLFVPSASTSEARTVKPQKVPA